jgi:hypothetical protein
VISNPADTETKAMEAASTAAGEYLEDIGKTDLLTLSTAEWVKLIEVICSGYVTARTDLRAAP